MYSFDVPKDGFMTVEDWRIQLWSKSEGPWATLTINAMDADPKKGIFVIKNYSENLGVLKWLKKKGFILRTLSVRPCGDGDMVLCKLDVEKIKVWGQEKNKDKKLLGR